MNSNQNQIQSRRAFVKGSSLILLGASMGAAQPTAILATDSKRLIRVGMMTDLHYADKDPAGSRHYRESISKLESAKSQFIKGKPDFVVELGDFIDAADEVETEKSYLKKVNDLFKTIHNDRHYVLGNHCVQTLTKAEFLEGVGQAKSNYSFDSGGYHFVILDSCFRSDGTPYGRKNFVWTDANIPAEQIKWLKSDLQATKNQTIVFVHQRLDVTKNHSVKNAAEVRKVLEKSGKVTAVFQGHSHKNSHQLIGGIHYVVLTAMVEGSGKQNSGFSNLDLMDDGSIELSGFVRQANYRWQ